MSKTGLPPATETSLSRDVLYAVRYYLGGRRGLIALAAIVVAAGLAFNWSWLVAAGIAPLLVAALPCVAMCALGLCMSRMTGRSCSADAVSQVEHTTADEPNDGSRRQSRDAGLPTLEE